MEESSVTKQSGVERINAEFSEEEFLRETLLRLSVDTKTPDDILSGNFEQVQKHETPYIIVSADTNVSFTCQIGNDRVEEYWDKEKYYENGIEKYRDVKKQRTVTDWTPFGGTNSGKYKVVVRNDGSEPDSYRDDYVARDAIAKSKPESFSKCGDIPFSVNGRALNEAKRRCIGKCFFEAVPGKNVKDDHHSGNATVTDIVGLMIPEYCIDFTYKGNKLTAKSFACGNLSINYKVPASQAQVEEEERKNLLKKKRLPFIIAAIVCGIVGLIFEICAAFVPALRAIGTILMIAGIIIIPVALLLTKNKMMASILRQKQQQKKLILIDTLKKMNLKPLTDGELNLINY